jgi:hypothetical protein
VQKSGAFILFTGNAAHEMANGMTQLSSPSSTARFQTTMVSSRAKIVSPLHASRVTFFCCRVTFFFIRQTIAARPTSRF